MRDSEFIVMYHGAIMRERGVDKIIDLLKVNRNIRAVILGNDVENGQYVRELKESAAEVATRVYFHPAVPLRALWKYVGAADLGMILSPCICKNALYSLPNKFFENIQAETPIVCPNYPAMKRVMDEYGLGLTYDPNDLGEINDCVERMRTDGAYYAKCKENVKRAKVALCWENEKETLKRGYARLMC